MEMIYLDDRREKDAFAERAAAHFAIHPGHNTYTDREIVAGAYFAVRFGLGDDCVVVFKIGDDMPTNYQNLVPDYPGVTSLEK